ncbi:hypothetical protein F4804DRAFT_351237 [Jackrogersella minutella]|nr:hypothetical protein F4804DRAFT_351237 [Jackrogersella minutella]
MAQNWVSQLSNDRYLQGPETQKAVPVIREVVENERAPALAASDIASIHESRIRNGDTSPPLELWRVFCSAIDRFGGELETLDRLIELLRCLSELDVLDANGLAVHSTMNGDTFWRQLPGFSIAFRDAFTGEFIHQIMQTYIVGPNDLYLGVPYVDEIENDGKFEEETRRFYNANIFQARWIINVGQAGPRREWGSAVNFALWHLSDALEYGIARSPMGLRRTELYIPQAAQWIQIAGTVIYKLCRDREKNTGEAVIDIGSTDKAVDGFLFRGEEGFSIERWAFWKERFSQIAGLNLKPHVSQLANAAAQRMVEIEISCS